MKNKVLQGLNAYITGHLAEQKACSFLQKKGYKLVARNIRTYRGIGANEIDLIMTKDKTLVFVEVKKRASVSDGAYAITPTAQKRIYRAAEIFWAQHPEFADYFCRFDAVFICEHKDPVHITDAWRG